MTQDAAVSESLSLWCVYSVFFKKNDTKISTVHFIFISMGWCKKDVTPVREQWWSYVFLALTHWGRVTHICVSKLTIIGLDNGLSPGRRQAIIWTNAGILLIGPLGTNFSEILINIHTFSFINMPLKMSSAKWRPFCFGLNELTHRYPHHVIVLLGFLLVLISVHRWQHGYTLHPRFMFQQQEQSYRGSVNKI